MIINFFNETDKETSSFEALITTVLGNLDKEKIMNIIFVTPQEIQKINREYRDKDTVTDVISFASIDSEDVIEACGLDDAKNELGDIFICLERGFSQANEYGHSIEREISFLATHGYLHLLGYDHLTKEQEEEMFSLQEKILNDAGQGRTVNGDN